MAPMTMADELVEESRKTPRRGPWRSSARVRILGWYVALLALATVASVVLLDEALTNRLDARVEEDLVQEAEELAQLVRRGVDPATGEPFGTDIRAIFTTFFQRTVPNSDEAFLAIVDGAPFLTTDRAPAPLDVEVEQVARWASVRGVGRRDTIETPAGEARTLAVPLETGGATSGVFVIAEFRAGEQREVDDAVRTAAAVSLSVLLAATVLAWFVAGRVLAPVRLVTDTARRITESDLSRRIPVRGHDEIAELTTTFNGMVDRLETAFLSQRRFVDDAGHELRTPITIVRGHLELMGDDPVERRETIELVTGELDRMARIVDELLLLAKAEQADFLQLETVPLAALVEEVHAKAPALGPREWRLERPGPGSIVADRQRLTQVLINLLQNAVQHSEAGSPVTLGARIDGSVAHLWVADAGAGVAAADRERIFTRFGRAAASRRRSEGAGLGLAIVSTVAAAHGGSVALESEPGHGARFTLTVPVEGPPAAGAPA